MLNYENSDSSADMLTYENSEESVEMLTYESSVKRVEKQPSVLKRRVLPAAVLCAFLFGLAYVFTKNNDFPMAGEGQEPKSLTGGMPSPVPDSNSEQPPTPSIYAGQGIIHPYTHLLYLYANDPAGYEGWDCFHVPQGGNDTTGTTWGGVLVGGLSAWTIDTKEAAAFLDGVDQPPVTFDATTHPDTWPSRVRLIYKNQVVCSR
jgi:hypothetical protein